MMHDYHQAQPGFSEAQILYDGCGECEARSEQPDHGLSSLDRASFYAAWARAAQWNRAGLDDLARAEMPLLAMLWAIQLKLEAYANVPIGAVP
jgi:hypothetical protein